jgi:hypothetical protein
MLRPNYTMVETAGDLTVRWDAPSLPPAFLGLGLALLVIGLAAAFLRKPLVRALQAQGGAWLTSKRAVGAGLAVAFAGLAFSLLAGSGKSFIRWDIGAESVRVQSLNGDLTFPWRSVRAARLDRKADPDAALVLTNSDGKDMWLVLKWLLPDHRLAVIEALGRKIPQVMEPVLNDKTYRSNVLGDEEAPPPAPAPTPGR